MVQNQDVQNMDASFDISIWISVPCASSIWTCVQNLDTWNPCDEDLSKFQTRPDFEHSLYSRCLKSERSVWKTEQNLVWISDIWAVPFIRSFGYTINVRNPNVPLVESNNRTSEIGTKWFGFLTLPEIRTVWEWDNFRKRRNPNIRISVALIVL